MSYEDLSSEKNKDQQEKLLDNLNRLNELSKAVLDNSKIIAEALHRNSEVQ